MTLIQKIANLAVRFNIDQRKADSRQIGSRQYNKLDGKHVGRRQTDG